MHSEPTPLLPPPAEKLRFVCEHCGGGLEVSVSMAGVRGPCPGCGADVTAPQWNPPAAPRRSAAVLFARPPRRKKLPPPLAPVTDPGPVSGLPVRPILLPEEPEVPAAVAEPAPATEAPLPAQPAPAPATRPVLPPLPPKASVLPAAPVRPILLPAEPPEPLATEPVRLAALVPPVQPPLPSSPAPAPLRPIPNPAMVLAERGIFAVTKGDDSKPARPFRRRRWLRWVDLGLVSVFTGLLLTSLAALRFTVPSAVRQVAALPENLAEQVEQESRSMALRQSEAELVARASVMGYLGAASREAAVTHLLPPPRGMAEPPFPPFPVSDLPGTRAEDFEVRASRRIPGTDRFLVVVGPRGEGQRGPVFVVEETDTTPLLHAGAISQQSAGLYEKLVASPGDGEAVLYVDVRPSVAEGERDYRQGRPDLAGFRMVDVRSAFPSKAPAFIACFRPDSEPARRFARRAHDPVWRPAMVRVHWQRHRESGPFVELTEFIPGTWSGERAATTTPATAANLR